MNVNPCIVNWFAVHSFTGRRIFQYLKTRKIRGETGQVAFDDNGDRIYAEYDVINIREKQHKKIVGKYYYDNVSDQFSSLIARSKSLYLLFDRINTK